MKERNSELLFENEITLDMGTRLPGSLILQAEITPGFCLGSCCLVCCFLYMLFFVFCYLPFFLISSSFFLNCVVSLFSTYEIKWHFGIFHLSLMTLTTRVSHNSEPTWLCIYISRSNIPLKHDGCLKYR